MSYIGNLVVQQYVSDILLSPEPPVRRTPSEILLAIFSEIYNEPAYAFEVGRKGSVAFAISHAELTSMALRRSKDKELNIMFIASEDACMMPSLVEAFRLVTARSQFLRDLDLYFPPSFIPLLSTLAGRVPVLRRCAVRIFGDATNAEHRIDAFAVAPWLEDVTLLGFDSWSTISVPYLSITSYEDFSLHMWYFWAVYQRPWMGRFHSIGPPVECPGICVFVASQGALFRGVTLPLVRAVVVESERLDSVLGFTDGDCLPAVYDLIIRSQCHKTSTQFSVYDTRLTGDIFDVLSELPCLTTLPFHFTRWYEECDAIIHDVVIALSFTVGGDVLGAHCVMPVLRQLIVTASKLLDNGRGSVGVVCPHFTSMVES
ncbi:uncharacterized protein EV420DRAFT_1477356 [Desarmillaria tabescens]|uniref:Uncharacterized protein n=1 Tax=Armillaria tabescens TaxID=1929756 RepID=A0AA39NBP0_ARMTA|nr:uncharacterized protein EV420DRAFT_1477356 [Desarmillaria tabescens]KAK0462665.1 hypothetical protein EV420DRAFT_1477356 [Desarmillaria tabescens]